MKKNGFTLVELLAVIAILGLILVIAVPKVTNIMKNSKKRTLELSVKSIAKSAEETYLENESFGIDEEITCESVSNISNDQYETCEITFDGEGNASVIFVGKGSYEGLYVCNGTKTSATATEEECETSGGNGDTEPAVSFIEGLLVNEATLNNGLVKTSAIYNGTTYDAGIRYVGPLTGDNAVKNQVYFNCEDEYISESKTIKYGDDDYVYKDHCEVWRIIGVFNTKEDENDTEGTPRIKIININSTFEVSWDSSSSSSNSGIGVNQWGELKDANGNIIYAGADIMQLLNGYYIEKNDSTIAAADKKECKYNKETGQSGFSQTCDTTDEPLSSKNMKPLTSTALNMISNAVWDTYGVKKPSSGSAESSWAAMAYLQEKGISTQYTGKSECSSCSDGVTRTTSWTGLIGLISVSDITYANGWLYNSSVTPWAITPCSDSSVSRYVWYSSSMQARCGNASFSNGVWPVAYLSSNVKIIGGDGSEGNAYKLSINSGQ